MSKSMSKSDAARIQAAEAKANGGVVAKGGFASRAQAAAAHNSSLQNAPSTTGNKSGGNRGNNPSKSK